MKYPYFDEPEIPYSLLTRQIARPQNINEITIESMLDEVNKADVNCWQKKLNESLIKEWLSNFSGECFPREEEHKIALYLLLHFCVFNLEEVQHLCRESFSNYLHHVSDDNLSIENINHIVEETIFVPIGNPSESGANLLYYFRTENNLSKKFFIYNYSTMPPLENRNIVFVDDVTLTGTQFFDYISESDLNELKKTNNIFVLYLIADFEAIERIKRKYPFVQIISSMEIDTRSRAFSSDSFISDNRELIEKCRLFVMHYGQKVKAIYESYGGNEVMNPMGHGSKSLLFGFFYNTPDNVPPIFWYQGDGWKSLFRRAMKDYNEWRGVKFPDELTYI